MEDDKLHNKFLKLFQGFIKDLIVTLPDYSETLTNTYEKLLDKPSISNIQKSKQLSNFANCIYENNTLITKRNKDFFNSEPKLLENISMKQLWNQEITPKNRNIIWKYLQSCCIIIMNIKSSDNLKKLLSGSQETMNNKDLKDLKKLNTLTDTIKEQSKSTSSESTESESTSSDSNGLESLLESSSIGKLAKDIASNLDLGELSSQFENNEGMDIGKIMQSTNFMDIFKKINEQVQDKFSNGEIDDKLLSGEAEKMLPNMINNPFFKNMMNSDMFKNMEKQT